MIFEKTTYVSLIHLAFPCRSLVRRLIVLHVCLVVLGLVLRLQISKRVVVRTVSTLIQVLTDVLRKVLLNILLLAGIGATLGLSAAPTLKLLIHFFLDLLDNLGNIFIKKRILGELAFFKVPSIPD